MRILHVIPSLDPAGGGPPMVATRLAAAQTGLGHTTAIWAYDEPHAAARIETVLNALPNHAAIGRLSSPRGGTLETLLGSNAARTLNQAAQGFDIIHMHGVWETAILRAAGAARATGIPYCITPHGMLDPWCLTQRALKKKLALALAFKRMLNGAAFLHTLNTDERDLLKPLGLTATAEVIPNGVFLEEIDPLPPPGAFRAKHPELSADPYILFLSRIHYKKGLDFLADAFALVLKEVPTARLVVAGPDGGEQANFQARVRSLRIEPRVHLTGPIYGPDKVAALVDAAAFCLPSRQEGFSMAITEAMACGLPVVVSPECHFPEVEQESAGLIAPLQPSAIAAALVKLLRDPALRSAMSRRARDLVVQRFTWPKITEVCLAAYSRHSPRAAAPSR